jgi:hypothetical protein
LIENILILQNCKKSKIVQKKKHLYFQCLLEGGAFIGVRMYCNNLDFDEFEKKSFDLLDVEILTQIKDHLRGVSLKYQ